MKTLYEKFITGPLDVNTYIVRNEQKSCLVIDPSSNCEEVIDYLKVKGLSVEAVVLTHGHFDHILGIPEILSGFPAIPVYIHSDDRAMLSQPLLNGSVLIGEAFTYSGENVFDLAEGEVEIGPFHLNVLHIPGHSSGGCALVMGDVCFCGDIVFAGSIGRTDLPGGDGRALVSGIRHKLLSLPDNTVLCPGHGGRTTVGREKKMNPFL
ncbi:MAG: MBL fold metallo-hydrolase [Chitinispirillaceae bacterium]